MSRFIRYALASAVLALPATVHAQAPATPDSAHHATAKARRKERKEEKKEERAEAAKGEKHPEMKAALRSLEKAKAELERAAHDFGGHRVEALKATEEAIKHTRLALEFDKK